MGRGVIVVSIMMILMAGCSLFRKEPLLVEEVEEYSSSVVVRKAGKKKKEKTEVVVSEADRVEKISRRQEEVVEAARSYLGTPYKYGGMGRDGMDCSGLTTQCYKRVGIELPRISQEQAKMGIEIPKTKAQPGDLIYFWTGKKGVVSHVGIISRVEMGEIYFIHSATSGGVREDQLSNPYWQSHFMGIRRLLK